MFKRRCFVCLLALLLAAALCGCAEEETGALPQLVIGYDDYRPYSYTDEDGLPAGIDVELAKEACRRIGYEPVFQKISWHDRDVLLKEGVVDCLWRCYTMNGREEQYAWVGPYMNSRQVVAVLQESPIRLLSDLQGKKVAVKSATRTESLLLERNDPRIPQLEELYCLTEMENVAAALRDGYVDACAGFAATLAELLQNSGVGYRFLDENLLNASLGVAFQPESHEQERALLASALEQMHRDGTTARILRSYGLNSADALGGIELEEN